MQVAARRPLPAGIAIVGAAVIAVAPIAPTLPVHVPDVHLPSLHQAQVELTALTNPLEAWAQVVTAALGNIGQLGGELAADPAPIIQKIIQGALANGAVLGGAANSTLSDLGGLITGLPAILQNAASQAAAGDIPGAVSGIIQASLPSLLNLVTDIQAGFAVVTNVAQNAASVVAQVPNLLLPGLLAVAAPAVSLANAGADTAQALVAALTKGDVVGIAGALLNAPATIVGAALNGYGNGPLGLPSGGIISPGGAIPPFTAGAISGLLAIRDIIANALQTLSTPAATPLKASVQGGTPVAELTAPANTVTVSVPDATASTGTATTKPATTESQPEKNSAAGESVTDGKSTAPEASPTNTGKVDDTASGTTKGGDTEISKGSVTDTASGKGDTATSVKTGSPSSSTGSDAGSAASSHETAGSAKDSSGSDSGAKSSDNSTHKSESK